MTTPPPVTDIFARFIADTDYSTISDKALANAKLHMLDAIGTALAALSTPVASIALDYCRSVGGAAESTVWGTGLKLPTPMAAFANGLLAHALDYDDWDAYIHAGHPTSMVLAAALTIAEQTTASGRDLLKAYVFGIEALTKLAAAAPDLHKRGFHSTPVWGSIGAALAAASVIK